MRNTGKNIFASNLEVQFAEPLDSRSIVPYYADLFNDDNWKSYDGQSYAYAGIVVNVYNDPDTTKNGLYRLNGLPTIEGNWEKVGSSATATDAEYLEGLSQNPPTVKQVKTDINNNVENLSNTINNLSLPTLPSSRFLIVKDALNSSENNSMIFTDNIITIKPMTLRTNRDEEITITEKTFDIASLENGIYYLYYNKDTDTVEYALDFIVGAGLPYETIDIPFTVDNIKFSSVYTGSATTFSPANLFDGNPNTFTITNGKTVDEYIQVNIDPRLEEGQFINLKFGTRPDYNLPTMELYGINDLEQETLLGSYSGNKLLVHDVDLSLYSVTDFVAFKIKQTAVSSYNFGLSEFNCFYKRPIHYTNGIYLNSGQYNFGVTKHNGDIITIPNITMLGTVQVENGLITKLLNYPFMFNHFSTETINYENSITKQEFNSSIEIINNTIDGNNEILSSEIEYLKLYQGNKINKLYDTITSNGAYTLSDSVANYDALLVNFGLLYSQVKDLVAYQINPPTLIPYLTSNTSDSDYIAYATRKDIYAYRAFNDIVSNNPAYSCDQYYAVNAAVGVQRLSAPIRTNMFTVHQGSSTANYIYSTVRCQIQGSNDGETWDILIDDTKAYAKQESRVYYLDDYVEYHYIQFVCITPNSTIKNFILREFLIQDTVIHNIVGTDSLFSSSNYFGASDKGTFSFEGNILNITNYTKAILNVNGLQYNKATSNPIGAIIAWELETLPIGFLWCDNSIVPDEFPDLQLLMTNTPDKPGFIIQAVPQSYSSGGGSGVSDYNKLDNLPTINDIVIDGNKTGTDYGLASLATNSEYIVGTATNLAPTIKQVKDDFNLILNYIGVDIYVLPEVADLSYSSIWSGYDIADLIGQASNPQYKGWISNTTNANNVGQWLQIELPENKNIKAFEIEIGDNAGIIPNRVVVQLFTTDGTSEDLITLDLTINTVFTIDLTGYDLTSFKSLRFTCVSMSGAAIYFGFDKINGFIYNSISAGNSNNEIELVKQRLDAIEARLLILEG